MIVRCKLLTDDPGRYFYKSLRDKPIKAKNYKGEEIILEIVKKYYRPSVGIVDEKLRWLENNQEDDIYLGINGKTFLVNILTNNVQERDIIIIPDNELYVYEETNYKTKIEHTEYVV